MRSDRFHPLAAVELEEAVAYFESIELGKGLEFLDCVQGCVEQLLRFPESAPVVRQAIRSLPVQPTTRWQYAIHYEALPNLIHVLALAHYKRQPFCWLGRREG